MRCDPARPVSCTEVGVMSAVLGDGGSAKSKTDTVQLCRTESCVFDSDELSMGENRLWTVVKRVVSAHGRILALVGLFRVLLGPDLPFGLRVNFLTPKMHSVFRRCRRVGINGSEQGDMRQSHLCQNLPYSYCSYPKNLVLN